jgi:hypothetical protein
LAMGNRLAFGLIVGWETFLFVIDFHDYTWTHSISFYKEGTVNEFCVEMECWCRGVSGDGDVGCLFGNTLYWIAYQNLCK